MNVSLLRVLNFKPREKSAVTERNRSLVSAMKRTMAGDSGDRWSSRLFDALHVRGDRVQVAREFVEVAALVCQQSAEAMIVTDADNRVIAINPAFVQLTGFAASEVIGREAGILAGGPESPAFYRRLWEAIETDGRWQGELSDRRKNGEVFTASMNLNTLYHEDRSVKLRVALLSDLTARRNAEDLIWRQAHFDALTGLPNRQMLLDRLVQVIDRIRHDGAPLALLFIELDQFKEVNETFGHDDGDILAVDVARRISRCVRETACVACLGGDKFAIALTEPDDIDKLDHIAARILSSLASAFQLDEEKVFVAASIGIARYPDDATDAGELFRHADQAMHAAKNAGRNRYSYYSDALQATAQRRMRLTSDLHGALTGRQFKMYFQPIVDLATGCIRKAEALIRWEHPTLGMISPTEFIPLAEATGLIIDIGEWAFRESARQVKHLRATYHPAFQISVNVSPVQLGNDASLARTWLEYLAELQLHATSMTIEITEGILLDATPEITEKLRVLRDAGINVSLDDFGTGYSSLAYLKKFDLDYLKIDQSFVRDLDSGPDDKALCEAIVVMAHKLGLKVIAEGVETATQRDLLVAADCDFVQGYLFSTPVPANEFEALLIASESRIDSGMCRQRFA